MHLCGTLREQTRRIALLIAALLLGLALALVLVQPAHAAVSYTQEELAFAKLINDYRVSNGLKPLLLSDRLSESGDRHSSDMGKYRFFDHYTQASDWFTVGASPWDRMGASGYAFNTYKGENIAAGYATAASVFAGWKASPGHNENMLNSRYTVMGVSFVTTSGSPYTNYWTTDFGGYTDSSAHADGASPTTTAPKPTTTTTVPGAAPGGFTDVGTNTPYREQIQALAKLGIVDGRLDGSFGPNDPVTRQQFAKMLALTMRYPAYPVTASAFGDVTPSLSKSDPAYPGGYIAACYDAGVVVGTRAGTFAPYDPVLRAQLITIVSRAAGLPALAAGSQPPFPDFSADHYTWAARAWAAGLLDGLQGLGPNFNFWRNATRGEACLLLAKLVALRGQ